MTPFQKQLGDLVHGEMLAVASKATEMDEFAPLLADLTNVLAGVIGVASDGHPALARALCADVGRSLPDLAVKMVEKFNDEVRRRT